MTTQGDHGACVDAWMERVARGRPSGQVIQSFEQGYSALWRRAHRTLGDVTLTAIAGRVLVSATKQFPFLSGFQNGSIVRNRELIDRAGSLPPEELARGIRFVLVELLTVLGNLTAGILTEPLHAELSGAGAGPDVGGMRAEPPVTGSKDGEGTRGMTETSAVRPETGRRWEES